MSHPSVEKNTSKDSKKDNQIQNINLKQNAVKKLEELKKYLEELSPTYLPTYYDFADPKFDLETFPISYRTNTTIEAKMLYLVKIFRNQYRVIFRSRKRLLLTAKNECNVKKFICTYICPVQWKFPEFYDWQGASNFVSDHLNFMPLLPTTEIPDKIYSSTTILRLQKGNCFDYTTLLCSLLIGVGYDAYVVSGYATRECCFMDQTRSPCPCLICPEPLLPPIKLKQVSKYVTKPLKTFRSQYDMVQMAKELQKKKEEVLKQEEINKNALIESEKPHPDPLYGIRVHSWILIKAGQRDIVKDFFIESLTGNKVDLKNKMYLGIESFWNDKNYWINKFCCLDGLKNLEYNLDDLSIWEPILPQDDHIVGNYSRHNTEDDEPPSVDYKEGNINMPLSWVRNLTIDIKTYEKRFPSFQKLINYYKVQHFRYSPYYCLSGLVTRIKIYDDREYTKLTEVHEYLENREDKHYKTIIKDGWITEFFKEGNEFYLKEHSYWKANPGKENDRELKFYEETRVDGLVRRVETPTSIEEFYKNRNDYLHYMHVEFVPRLEGEEDDDCYRQIHNITKKFLRNPTKKAEDDIMELNYAMWDEKISVIYHRIDGSIISSTREYNKPAPSTDGRNTIHMYPDTHSFFSSNSSIKNKTNLEAYEILRELMSSEKVTMDDVHWSENDTRTIIRGRIAAKRSDIITINLYDTIRNFEAKAKHQLIDKEYLMNLNAKEEQLDFLSPYFAQQNIIEVTNKEQAFIIRESCLYDLKQRLISQANLIRSRFEAETDMLQKKQTWYYQNKMILSLEEENKYLAYCSETVSLLDTLENLLTRHKQTAPHKYMELERRIQRDPRLAPFMK